MSYGRWWAVQSHTGVSLGVHLDWHRHRTNSGVPYGPYVDFHVGSFVISLGVNPIYAGEVELLTSYSRGGLRA